MSGPAPDRRDAEIARLNNELDNANGHLEAAYEAAGHSLSSSEPLSCAIERLRTVVDAAAWSMDMKAAPKYATLLDLWCPDSHAYAVRGRFWEQDGQWIAEESTRVLRPRAWRLLPPLPPAPGDSA